jgi:L-glyceraldehyde 3-phosphate reductase
MINRWIEDDRLLDTLEAEGVGAIVFSPLAQGLLTDKARRDRERRGQTLAQMALAWTLRDKRVTSALIGASSPEQVGDSVKALDNLPFTAEELSEVDRHAVDGGVNLWRQSAELAPL